MKILVTGASGFLGRYTVAELLRRGHQIRAVVRPNTDVSGITWHDQSAVELVRLDLEKSDLAAALQGVNAVVHLAAAKAGDLQTQYASTVISTESLLKAMAQIGVSRLIAISTFSVYDYLHLQPGTTIDEHSPIEPDPNQRDVYAQTKLIQEKLVQGFANQGGQVTILRPGIVYGRDALWNASLGVKAGNRLWLRIGANAILPLTYVENCAAAISNAVEHEQSIGKIVNIIDDDLPTQRVYANELLKRMPVAPTTVAIGWPVMQVLANLIWQSNKTLFAERLKLPGLLIPARLHARFKPLQYSNAYAKQVLAWTPQYSLNAALDRSCSHTDLLAISPSLSQSSSL